MTGVYTGPEKDYDPLRWRNPKGASRPQLFVETFLLIDHFIAGRSRQALDRSAKDGMMTLGNFSLWSWGKPKPLSTRGTKAAFAAGRRALQKNGVNPHLKEAVKLSLRNSRRLGAQRSV
jgi:hypothetical protein